MIARAKIAAAVKAVIVATAARTSSASAMRCRRSCHATSRAAIPNRPDYFLIRPAICLRNAGVYGGRSIASSSLFICV